MVLRKAGILQIRARARAIATSHLSETRVIVPSRAVSCRLVPSRAVSCRLVPSRAVSCRLVSSRHTPSHRITPHHSASRQVTYLGRYRSRRDECRDGCRVGCRSCRSITPHVTARVMSRVMSRHWPRTGDPCTGALGQVNVLVVSPSVSGFRIHRKCFEWMMSVGIVSIVCFELPTEWYVESYCRLLCRFPHKKNHN